MTDSPATALAPAAPFRLRLGLPGLVTAVATAAYLGAQAGLAARGHALAADIVDAALVVGVLHLGVLLPSARGKRAQGAFAALAFALVVPVAAAGLTLNRLSAATGQLTVAAAVGTGALLLVLSRVVEPPHLARRREPLVQLAPALAAVPLGFLAFSLHAPLLWTHSSARLALAVAALVAAALVEELVYRGILQQALGRMFGRAGVLLATVVSVVPYVGVGWSLLPASLAALGFALAVGRTRALLPAYLGRITFTVVACIACPAVFAGRHQPLGEIVSAALLGVIGLAVSVLVLRSRGAEPDG
jgi:membrane protease YdiL (CAAX protease family)